MAARRGLRTGTGLTAGQEINGVNGNGVSVSSSFRDKVGIGAKFCHSTLSVTRAEDKFFVICRVLFSSHFGHIIFCCTLSVLLA